MAKLRAHGHEVGTILLTTSAKRYMSDGKILKNAGFGWKLFATVKEGIPVADAFQRGKARAEAYLAAHPALAAYRKELHDMAPLSKRWKLDAALRMMPDDPDGVWSECCDGYGDNISADVDEVVVLCRLYCAAVSEQEQQAKAKAEDAQCNM